MNKLYFLVSRFAIALAMASMVSAFGLLHLVYYTIYIPVPVIFAIAFALSSLGYFLQYLMSSIFSPILQGFEKKGIVPFLFNKLIPLLLVLLFTYGVSQLPSSFFNLFRIQTGEVFTIQQSGYEFGLCTHFGMSLFVGMLMWRDDADQAYSEPLYLAVCSSIVAVCYIFKIGMNFSLGSEMWQSESYCVFLLLVIISYALLSSQMCVLDLRESMSESVDRKADNRALMYNYLFLLLLVPFFILVWLCSWLAVSGVGVIIRGIFSYLVPFANVKPIGAGIFGVLHVISVVFLFVMIILLIIREKLTKILSAAAKYVAKLVSNFLYDVLDGIERMKRSKESEDCVMDEEKTQAEDIIAEYHFEEHLSPRDNFDSFLRRLQRLPDLDRQIGFAYRKVCEMYRADGASIKSSDTPREVAKKLTMVSENERQFVVEMIERVKFSSDSLSDDDKDKILAELCRIIRRQYI